MKSQAIERGDENINDNSHYKIMDEIIRRESLVYDPTTRVLVGEEEEDNFDSDDEE